MNEKPPLEWIRRVHEGLRQIDAIPLFGTAPPIDWESVSELLCQTFGLTTFQVAPKMGEWKEKNRCKEGMGDHPITVMVQVSPLSDPIYWVMGRADLDKLTSGLLHRQGKGKAFTSATLQEGFYRFLLLQMLQTLQQVSPFQNVTLSLGEGSDLPDVPSFCLDVSFAFDEKACWGRLILPSSFRKAWAQLFSTFPFEYLHSPLAQKAPLPVTITGGDIFLNLSQWKKLKEGDFLPLDRMGFDPKQEDAVASCMLGKMPLFNARIRANQIELLDYALIHEEPMQNNSAPFEEEDKPVSIGDTPMHVVVELSRIQMTLGKLMQLSPGNILELPIHPEQGVSLTVNGQKVGSGELISLGDVLGVRILEMG